MTLTTSREYKEKQRQIIEERRQQSEERHKAVLQEAEEAIDNFYKAREAKAQKAAEENRLSFQLCRSTLSFKQSQAKRSCG